MKKHSAGESLGNIFDFFAFVAASFSLRSFNTRKVKPAPTKTTSSTTHRLQKFFIAIIFLLINMPLLAETLRLNLKELEKEALSNSPKYKSACFEEEAAYRRARQALSRMYPKLSLEGYYRYNTEVPEMELNPPAPPRKLTDNTNYSFGPALNWVIWDPYLGINSYKNLLWRYNAKSSERELIERQLILAVRTTYARLVLAADRTVLIADALKLAQAQYKDILINVKNGAKTRMDGLSGHQEVLRRMSELLEARSDISQSLHELYAVLGKTEKPDLSAPCDARCAGSLPENASRPTCLIQLEDISSLNKVFGNFRKAEFFANHPGIEIYSNLAVSAEYALKQARLDFWPAISLSARTSIDYPDGPNPESIHQNSAGAAFSWPIFESGKNLNKSLESKNILESARQRQNQALIDIKKQWHSTLDELGSLIEREKLNEQMLDESDEIARIVYKSFMSGYATFLEVENANFKALKSKMELAGIKTRIFINLAVLAGLSEKEQ